ncbi:hypothetical protein RRG08_023005 [Elysia crispata]|uniref:Uncharacterized protein n=1 Tax=Elysia crispata TaxID=231223 RepID=A0AAE1AEL2_9GAST|nr:hypothetical protein RRG08_023005 [Elysia crispata]
MVLWCDGGKHPGCRSRSSQIDVDLYSSRLGSAGSCPGLCHPGRESIAHSFSHVHPSISTPPLPSPTPFRYEPLYRYTKSPSPSVCLDYIYADRPDALPLEPSREGSPTFVDRPDQNTVRSCSVLSPPQILVHIPPTLTHKTRGKTRAPSCILREP